MPYKLSLPASWIAQGWKAKIRDRERLEPPHVTLLRGCSAWRISLRTGQFLDHEPDPAYVPTEVLEHVQANMDELRAAWDEMYPENAVQSVEVDDG
jgi:hypothetical protein